MEEGEQSEPKAAWLASRILSILITLGRIGGERERGEWKHSRGENRTHKGRLKKADDREGRENTRTNRSPKTNAWKHFSCTDGEDVHWVYSAWCLRVQSVVSQAACIIFYSGWNDLHKDIRVLSGQTD